MKQVGINEHTEGSSGCSETRKQQGVTAPGGPHARRRAAYAYNAFVSPSVFAPQAAQNESPSDTAAPHWAQLCCIGAAGTESGVKAAPGTQAGAATGRGGAKGVPHMAQ